MSSGEHELRIAVSGGTGAGGGQLVELLGERGLGATVARTASVNSAEETVAAGVLESIIKSFEDAPALVAATLILSASTDGKEEVGDLIQQSADVLNGRLDLEEDEIQTAFNLGLDPEVKELTATIAAQVDTL